MPANRKRFEPGCDHPDRDQQFPLINYEIVVNLIRHTTTKTGLRVQAALNTGTYETGMVVNAKEMASLKIERPEGQNQPWNDTIRPRVKTSEPKIEC